MNNNLCMQVLIGLTIVFLLFFSIIRASLGVVINYLLNKSNRKKRRTKQNFAEWFFYTRFNDVLPKILAIWYYGNIAVYLTFILLAIAFCIFRVSETTARSLISIYLAISSVPFLIFYTKTHDKTVPSKMNAGKWLERKKRNKR